MKNNTNNKDMEIKAKPIKEAPKVPGLIRAGNFLAGTALGTAAAHKILKPIDPDKKKKKKKDQKVDEKVDVAGMLPSLRLYTKRAQSLKSLADTQAEKTKKDIEKAKDTAKAATKKIVGEAKSKLIKKAVVTAKKAKRFIKKHPKEVAKDFGKVAGGTGLFAAADTGTRIATKEKEAKLALKRAHKSFEKDVGKRKAKKALKKVRTTESKFDKQKVKKIAKLGAGALGLEMAAELGVEGIKAGTSKVRAKLKKSKKK